LGDSQDDPGYFATKDYAYRATEVAGDG